MHLSVTTGNLISGKEKETALAESLGCSMSPETGLLPGHSTQQRVAVGNRATGALLFIVLGVCLCLHQNRCLAGEHYGVHIETS